MSITLNGITKRFGGKTVLDDLTATLPGGVICLSGASGCGKTTLAMIIAGLLKPDSGNIGGISGNVTVMFQEPRLFPAFSALENVACAAKGSSGEAEAEKLLLSLGLTADDINKKPCELSGGMNQRVARAVLFHENSGGNTVILDEPFKGLDPASKNIAAELVSSRLTPENLLVITHDGSDADLLHGTRINFSDL